MLGFGYMLTKAIPKLSLWKRLFGAKGAKMERMEKITLNAYTYRVGVWVIRVQTPKGTYIDLLYEFATQAEA